MRYMSVVRFSGLFLLCSIANFGCKSSVNFRDTLDSWSFSLVGGTIFSEPFQVTSKQLHFDTGDLFGQDVIFEGKVLEKGEAATHVLLGDKEGRILVILSQVEDAYKKLDDEKVERLKVLGRLERGKKGLAYILARAINEGDGQESM